MKQYGQQVWFFADGDRPPAGESQMKGHESIIILNPNGQDALARLTIYYEDRDPLENIEVLVKARRTRCLQTHKESDLGVHTIPVGLQYAFKVESEVPVIVQYGKLDARQDNLAYYATTGYCTNLCNE